MKQLLVAWTHILSTFNCMISPLLCIPLTSLLVLLDPLFYSVQVPLEYNKISVDPLETFIDACVSPFYSVNVPSGSTTAWY